jgi:hypothetical protein
MRHPIHEIWRHTYFDVIEERMSEVRKGTCRNMKNEKKDTKLDSVFKKKKRLNSQYICYSAIRQGI